MDDLEIHIYLMLPTCFHDDIYKNMSVHIYASFPWKDNPPTEKGKY